MTYPCHLSFAGCRTAAEAEERLRAWLAEMAVDSSRKLESDLLSRCGSDEGIDIDNLDDALEPGDEMMLHSIEEAVIMLHDIIDREGVIRH